MQVVASIEAIDGLIASVACRADHAGRNGEEDVEEGHGAEDADGHEDGELTAAARARLEGFDGEGYGAHDERLAGYVEDGIRWCNKCNRWLGMSWDRETADGESRSNWGWLIQIRRQAVTCVTRIKEDFADVFCSLAQIAMQVSHKVTQC